MLDRRLFHWENEFSRRVLRLAVPIVIQSLVVALMYVVDNWMIGQLGDIKLGGVTQANRITFLMQVTMFGVVSGASVLTAQYWGVRDVKSIHRTLGLGTVTAMVVSLLFALPSILCPQLLIGLLVQEPEVIQAGVAYLRVIGFAYLVQGFSQVHGAVLKSTEQVKLPSVASAAAILCNTLFNYLLIFGRWGFPRLEETGGAIATLMGSCLELAILLGFSYRYRLPNAARIRDMAFTRQEAAGYFKVVLPTVLNEGFWSLGMVMYSAAYGRMGATTLAAVSIYNSVEQLASVVLRGATHACAVMVGIAIGAGKKEYASLTARRMLVAGIGTGILVGAVVLCISGPIANMFGNVSQQARDSAYRLVNTYAGFLWLQAAATLLIVGILRAGGDVRFALVIDVAPVWLVGIPLVFAFGPGAGWPIQYVYMLTRIEELLKSGIALLRFRSGKWIHQLVGN